MRSFAMLLFSILMTYLYFALGTLEWVPWCWTEGVRWGFAGISILFLYTSFHFNLLTHSIHVSKEA